MHTALSINVNKVALLRNSRHIGIPDVCRAAHLCLKAGAHGITVHPRPDERHIRRHDVFDLAALMKEWPQAEFNIEGNPFHNLMELVEAVRPHQCTLVPDSVDQFTSDHGWTQSSATDLTRVVEQLHAWGVRVSLFMDADASAMAWVKATGADRIELYTEAYARAHGTAEQAQVLSAYVEAAAAARRLNLGMNAGHDLNLHNIPDFLSAIPDTLEMSIGHAFMADALEMGYTQTVREYLRVMGGAYS